MNIAFAYIPVIHKGYIEFCNILKKEEIERLYLVSDQLLEAHSELDYINRKDRLRALSQKDIAAALETLTSLTVEILNTESLAAVQNSEKIFAPNEDISRLLAETYFKNSEVNYVNIFLRWNTRNIGEDKQPEVSETIELTEFQKTIFKNVLQESQKSFDWWRQVGAALVKEGEVITVVHNAHTPEAQLPNIIGDTRSLFKKGLHINFVTSVHAEAAAIGEAARRGIATEGAELYITDFPCPYCARLIAKSGIKKIYFSKGYAVLEGDAYLKEAGIEVYKVKI